MGKGIGTQPVVHPKTEATYSTIQSHNLGTLLEDLNKAVSSGATLVGGLVVVPNYGVVALLRWN